MMGGSCVCMCVYTRAHTCSRVRAPAAQDVLLPGPSSCSRGRWGGCPLLAGCPRLRGAGTAGRLPARRPAPRHLAPCQRRPPGLRHRAAFVPPAGHARLRARVCAHVCVCVNARAPACARPGASRPNPPKPPQPALGSPQKAAAGCPAPAAGHGCARPFRGTRGARGGRVVINLICTCKSSSV